MSNPLTNLGDYNIARDALKAAGGNWQSLYNSIGDTAVAKVAPKYLLRGGLIGAGVIGLGWAGREVWHFMKGRKQLIENEPTLKKKFAEVFKAETPMVNGEPNIFTEVVTEPSMANDEHTESVELN